jgi:hypothetical protein
VLEALALICTGEDTVAPFPGEDIFTETEPNAAVTDRSTTAIASFKILPPDVEGLGDVALETVCPCGYAGGIRLEP